MLDGGKREKGTVRAPKGRPSNIGKTPKKKSRRRRQPTKEKKRNDFENRERKKVRPASRGGKGGTRVYCVDLGGLMTKKRRTGAMSAERGGGSLS